MPKGQQLTKMQADFLAGYLSHGNGTRAAIEAGYSEKTATEQSCHMLKIPLIAAEVSKQRAQVQKKTGYNLEKAMAECDAAIEFAQRSPQGSNAYVKAVELKAKLNGLLVEKIDLRASVGFSVNIGGVLPPKDVTPMLPLPKSEDEDESES